MSFFEICFYLEIGGGIFNYIDVAYFFIFILMPGRVPLAVNNLAFFFDYYESLLNIYLIHHHFYIHQIVSILVACSFLDNILTTILKGTLIASSCGWEFMMGNQSFLAQRNSGLNTIDMLFSCNQKEY